MKSFQTGLLAVALLTSVTLVSQAQNLVLNGDFSDVTAPTGQLGFNVDAADWSYSGYNFLFAPGTADTNGVIGSYGSLQLWGPGNGSDNGMPATSPLGGNYVAADGAFEVGAISQTISNLFVGQSYTLSYYWAAAQQYTFTGDTTESWTASLGTDSQSTITYDLPSHGFSGWMQQTFTFTAYTNAEVLSFLAAGTPAGEPPFSLLAGVSLTATPSPAPEPTTIQYGALVLLPFCGGLLRRLRNQSRD